MTQNIIRLSKSCLSDAEKQAVIRVLDREYLGMGEEVLEFEQSLERFFGRPVVCVANGTAALHLVLQALKIKAGDEILVPSLTYVASYQAISATGAIPVSCDVEMETAIMDIKDAESRITRNTRAIMPVHYSGDAGDLDGVYRLAKKYNLRVVEDAAHAFGSFYGSKKIGGFGDIACFSFDGIKNITSGEGGCIVSEDYELISQIRDARLLGVQKDSEKRYQGQRSWDFDVVGQGWRYHMSNINAAIGIEQLKRFPEFSFKRQSLARKYDQILYNLNYIVPFKRNYDEITPHIYVVRVIGLRDRKKLQEKMSEQGIQVGFHYQPNHQLSFYSSPAHKDLPNTSRLASEIISLPLHPDLSDTDIEYICSALLNEASKCSH